MKNISFFIVVFTFLFIYFFISFINIEINFILWTRNQRIIYILCSLFFSFISVAFYNFLKDE